jgi:hypothetical protein
MASQAREVIPNQYTQLLMVLGIMKALSVLSTIGEQLEPTGNRQFPIKLPMLTNISKQVIDCMRLRLLRLILTHCLLG